MLACGVRNKDFPLDSLKDCLSFLGDKRSAKAFERIWAIVSAHHAGLSIRKIAGATGLSSSRIHQLLNAPEAKEIPVWLSQLRQSSRGSGGRKKAKRPESETEIRSRLAREVEVLRRCTDWLQRLERGENVVVNLRPDEDVETEFVAFARAAGWNESRRTAWRAALGLPP